MRARRLGPSARRTALGLALAAIARPLAAQGYTVTPRLQAELRAEAVISRRTSALVMAGANAPMGSYVRAGAAAGIGAVMVDGQARLAQRADVTARFLLDPFGETRWGPYAGGGLTLRRDGSERAEAGLLLVLGVEGSRTKRFTPAVELALGEGVRLAAVLRRTRTRGR